LNERVQPVGKTLLDYFRSVNFVERSSSSSRGDQSGYPAAANTLIHFQSECMN
jgi:hypothetical protein